MQAATAIPARTKSDGFLRVISNDQIAADEERARQQQRAAAEIPLQELSGYCSRLWEQHKRAKIPIEQKMIKALRQRYGEYDSAKLAQIIKAGGSKAFFKLTETKCRAAISWIIDILFQAGARPWGIQPTKLPDIPPAEKAAVMSEIYQQAIQNALAMEQQTGQPVNIAQLGEAIKTAISEHNEVVKWRLQAVAKAKSENMEMAIEDIYQEGGFYEALLEAIDDIVTLKAGGIRGPVTRKKRTKAWHEDMSGAYRPVVEERLVVEFERVNPFNLYPAPGARNIQDGDLIYHHQLTRAQLYSLIGVPGYIDENIRAALRAFERGGGKEWLWTDSELNYLRDNHMGFASDSVEISTLEYYVSVPGRMLMEFGIQGVTDPEREYEACVWKAGPHIIKAILNPDELGRRPFSLASFIRKADSVWGFGLPETVEHDQEGANAAFRATINNAGFCSGPMVEENIDRLAYGDTAGDVHPYKVYKVRSDQMMSSAPAIRFYQPKPVTQEMLAVLRDMGRFADDHSGIPAYAHGDDRVGGGGDTSSGLSMLMNAASRGIKAVVKNIDILIGDVTERTYDHLMVHSKDNTIKGDCKVITTGSNSMLVKEQLTIRRREVLRDTNNPVDVQIIGLEGRKYILEETLKGMDFDINRVFSTMPQTTMLAAPPTAPDGSQPGQPGMPSDQAPAPPNRGQVPAPVATDPAGNPQGGADLPSVQAGGA